MTPLSSESSKRNAAPYRLRDGFWLLLIIVATGHQLVAVAKAIKNDRDGVVLTCTAGLRDFLPYGLGGG